MWWHIWLHKAQHLRAGRAGVMLQHPWPLWAGDREGQSSHQDSVHTRTELTHTHTHTGLARAEPQHSSDQAAQPLLVPTAMRNAIFRFLNHHQSASEPDWDVLSPCFQSWGCQGEERQRFSPSLCSHPQLCVRMEQDTNWILGFTFLLFQCRSLRGK